MAWKNWVEPEVPDSITGATSRNDATINSAATSFVMALSPPLFGVGSPPHEGFVGAVGERRSNSLAIRASGELSAN
jgi:flavin reductase (DIM6/NTAB) family NADH-FMN oxidoreductase RutF